VTDHPRYVQVYYLYAKDPVFHQVAYGLLTACTIFRGFYVMERDLRPQLSQRAPTESARYMKEMYKLALTGLSHPSLALVFREWTADARSLEKESSCFSVVSSSGTWTTSIVIT
jgi:hypothetical protein